MKAPKHILLATIVAGSAAMMGMNSADAKGYCWGVTGLGEGGCEGKAPAIAEAANLAKKWPCGGGAPRAEWGWKDMDKDKCEASSFKNENIAAAFAAAGFKTPQHTDKAFPNPLYAKDGYISWLKKDLAKK